MKKSKYDGYDERQQLARGKAYQYACVTFVLEVLIWGLLREFEVFDADPFCEMLVFIALPLLVLFSVTIAKDAYDPMNSRPGVLLFSLMPLVGILMVIDDLRDHVVLVDGSYLTEDFGMVVLYSVWIIASAIYWTYYLRERRAEIKEAAESANADEA